MNDLQQNSTDLRATPRFTCPACGSPEAKGVIRYTKISISCPKCGVTIERPRCGTELEDACDIMNEAEMIRYEVNKSKKGI